MSETDSINGTLILTSELKSCGLRDLQIKISDFLENRRAVKQVRKCKTNNGEVIPGKFEVDLQNTKGELQIKLIYLIVNFSKRF